MKKVLIRAVVIACASCLMIGMFAAVAWARPANDDFDNSTAIVGNLATVYGNNDLASLETSEPRPAAGLTDQTVWWVWSPSSNGTVTIDTTGSSFQTALGVYAGFGGSRITSISAVATDVPASVPAKVAFRAIKDAIYWIQVDGQSGGSGDIVLTLSQRPDNDMFAKAQTITTPAVPGAVGVMAYNQSCTTETGEPMPGGFGAGASMWYSWTANQSGLVMVDTIGSEFDTVLGVFTGNDVAHLTQVAADNDAFYPGGPSKVVFSVTAGTTYKIAVDGVTHVHPYGTVADTGLFALTVRPLVATPRITSTGRGKYPTIVTLTCATPGAAIRYTTDGTDPSATSATYTGSFVLSKSTSVKARAFKLGFVESSVVAVAFPVRAALSLPSVSPAQPKPGKTFRISGAIAPGVRGRITTLAIERKVGGTFMRFLTKAAKNTVAGATLTRYVSAKLTVKAGVYRVRAYYADATHPGNFSGYRVFTVK